MGGSAVRAFARILAAIALIAGVTTGVATAANKARADEVTISQDQLRTGWDRNEPALSPKSCKAAHSASAPPGRYPPDHLRSLAALSLHRRSGTRRRQRRQPSLAGNQPRLLTAALAPGRP